tara:strand:+ start:10037 stop:10708 length:672 start_codon:yes stop_codon:yes gene_type:complete
MTKNQDTIHNVYLMPGMAANSLIFEGLDLPENFVIHYLEWLLPKEKESLNSYCKRLSADIKGSNIILIGVSFGGIIVQEISKIISVKKTIIISSVKTKNELPFMMTIGKSTGLYKYVPVNWIDNVESLAKFVFGPSIKKKIGLYRKYLSVRDEHYLRWCIDKIINWDNVKVPKNLIHIHGSLDLVFPSVYISNAILVKNATHTMILTKAKWLNKNIPELILKN